MLISFREINEMFSRVIFIFCASLEILNTFCQMDSRTAFKSQVRLTLHMFFGGALVAISAAGACKIYENEINKLSVSATALDAAKSRRALLIQSTTSADRESFVSMLPSKNQSDELLGAIEGRSSLREIQINSIALQPHRESRDDLSWIQFQISLRGKYVDAKTFLSELISRYPSLALVAIQMRAPSEQGTALTDVQVSLAWYVKD